MTIYPVRYRMSGHLQHRPHRAPPEAARPARPHVGGASGQHEQGRRTPGDGPARLVAIDCRAGTRPRRAPARSRPARRRANGVWPRAHQRGVAVFDELRQGVEDIEFLADPTAGELRIGAGESMAAGPVLVAIDRLSRQYPRISVHVATGNLERLCDELIQRNIEIALIRISGSIVDRQLVVERLFEDSYVVAAGAQNPWTRRRRVQLADLVNEPWVLRPFDMFVGAIIAQAFRASGLPPPRAKVFTLSINMHNRLLATGRYLGVLPSFSLRLPDAHPSLKALPVELPGTRQPTGIITVKNRTLSPLAQLFLDRLRSIVKPLTRVG
jgi:DNA-binding transcriptional LysR family regulator